MIQAHRCGCGYHLRRVGYRRRADRSRERYGKTDQQKSCESKTGQQHRRESPDVAYGALFNPARYQPVCTKLETHFPPP